MNRDERSLIGSPGVDMARDSLFVDRNFVKKLLCWCCNGADEFLSWNDRLKGSVRKGKELPGSLINKVAANWSLNGKKLKCFVNRLGKTYGKSLYKIDQSKSGRFQYDPLSYSLNFDGGSVHEDEYSLRTFSARYAAPVAKPKETRRP